MENAYYPGEKEISEWIKELEGELKDKTSPFYQPSVESLEKEIQKIDFRIGHLSVMKKQLEGGLKIPGIESKKILVRFEEKIGELKKKKQDKQDQMEKINIEIEYRKFNLQYLNKIIKQMV